MKTIKYNIPEYIIMQCEECDMVLFYDTCFFDHDEEIKCKKHSLEFEFQPIKIVRIYNRLNSKIRYEYWTIKYKIIPDLRMNLMSMSPLSRKIRYFIGRWSKDLLYVDRPNLNKYHKLVKK